MKKLGYVGLYNTDDAKPTQFISQENVQKNKLQKAQSLTSVMDVRLSLPHRTAKDQNLNHLAY